MLSRLVRIKLEEKINGCEKYIKAQNNKIDYYRRLKEKK